MKFNFHKMTFHPFHIVRLRPWPILRSFNSFIFITRLILFFHKNEKSFFFFSLILTFFNIYQWWRDITREGTFLGDHTIFVKNGLKIGVILFIIREIFFFLRFFWAFFHNSLRPDFELGLIWPPAGVSSFNPFRIPLLNTIILLSSGFSVTWSHHSLINKNFKNASISLFLTIFLGVYFTFLQIIEYYEASFSIADSVFGRRFFLTTGFHGLHVLIGTSFLSVNLLRFFFYHFNNKHHFGFEAAAWYWHFVDVVWIFLFTFIYWWIF